MVGLFFSEKFGDTNYMVYLWFTNIINMEELIINQTLFLIQYLAGIKLELCKDFPGLHYHNGLYYFNVIINDMVSESDDYQKLIRFAKIYALIKVEPNGIKRLSIYPIN